MNTHNNFISFEIFNLENQYWNALKNRDIDTLLALTDDQCLLAGAQGVSNISKNDLEYMMKSPNYQIMDFELSPEYHVNVLNENTAIIAYKVKENLTVEGKSVTIEASDASAWIRRNGKWVCSLHTEALSGDPFGRDRSLAV